MYFTLCFLALLIPVIFLSLLPLIIGRGQRFIHGLRRLGVKILFWVTGLRVSANSLMPGLGGGPCLIVANHTSRLDILTLIWLSREPICFTGKAELRFFPLLGLYFLFYDLPVFRGSKRGAARLVNQVHKRCEGGISVVFFPEGTVSSQPPAMLPFRSGAFRVACQKNLTLVPVVLENTWQLWPFDPFLNGRPGVIRVRVLPPLSPEKDEYYRHFRNRVRENMEQTQLSLFN